MSKNTPSSLINSPVRVRNWRRDLQPLYLWLLFVCVLFLLHTHQRLSEQTFLRFNVWKPGLANLLEEAITLDDKPFASGSRVSIGWHTFKITHPKTVTFSTNLFMWYGSRNLGLIHLERSTGVLAVQVDPQAQVLSIQGPEEHINLTNSKGITVSVPTDDYTIEAKGVHWMEPRKVHVREGVTNGIMLEPQLCALAVSCNQTQANFRLLDLDNRLMEGGDFPATIPELRKGIYRLLSNHHGNRQEQRVIIGDKLTNVLNVEFLYGAVTIDSEPEGAEVFAEETNRWGVTPFSLDEVQAGIRNIHMQRQGYEPSRISLLVIAHQTNSLRTNLFSLDFVGAIKAAREHLSKEDYDLALEAATNALQAKPEDREARYLQRQALGLGSLRRAEVQTKQANYVAALTELEAALRALPEDTRAQAMLPELKKRAEEEAAERRRLEAVDRRERRPKEYFAEWMKNTTNSDLFDLKEVKLLGSLGEIEGKLLRALTNDKPAFKLQMEEQPEPGLFRLRAMLAMGISGWRRVDLVGGQTSEGEVRLIFKVFEYAYPESGGIRALLGANDEKSMMPIHSSQPAVQRRFLLKRREEGVDMIRQRLSLAER